MFSDHYNLASAAAAVPAPESEPAETSPSTETNSADGSTEENDSEATTAETSAPVNEVPEEAHEAPRAQAESVPEKAAEPTTGAEGHRAGDSVDAEAADAAEEAAGSEEMSKLMEQYDEQQEAASQNELIEVKVVAYTEQGVVVDLGQKSEGLIPAAEFTETDIPRPEPNATIEQSRGPHQGRPGRRYRRARVFAWLAI